jgi:hypothetical protein
MSGAAGPRIATKKVRLSGAGVTEEDLKPARFILCLETALRRVVQQRALAQRRVTIDCLDQALGDGFGIQSEKLGELLHSFTVRQTDDDCAAIGWHPYKRDPFHVLYTHIRERSR